MRWGDLVKKIMCKSWVDVQVGKNELPIETAGGMDV